jgi:hypothetical protein
MVLVRGQLPFQLLDKRLLQADRHEILEPAAVVAQEADTGNASVGEVAGGGRNMAEECGRIALGHQPLRVLEQQRQAPLARIEKRATGLFPAVSEVGHEGARSMIAPSHRPITATVSR